MDRNKFYRIREELHRHPELSGQEKHTIQYIRQVLQEFQPSRIHPLEKGHGLVAEYSFPGEGPTLLFRADIDAVAIAEKSPLPYCSENPGVAHKCGHDGHTTMLLMLAGLLHEHPLERGRILLLFQPAEENGQGAQLVLQDPWFRQQKSTGLSPCTIFPAIRFLRLSAGQAVLPARSSAVPLPSPEKQHMPQNLKKRFPRPHLYCISCI